MPCISAAVIPPASNSHFWATYLCVHITMHVECFGIICSEKVTCRTDLPLFAGRQAACKPKTFQKYFHLACRASALISKAEYLFTNVMNQMPVQQLKISLDFYGISTHAAIQDLNMTGVPTSIYSAEALFIFLSICQRKPSLRGFGIWSIHSPVVSWRGKLTLLSIWTCANETPGSEF